MGKSIQFFLIWLKSKENLNKDKMIYLTKYFNSLLKILIKYEILIENWIEFRKNNKIITRKRLNKLNQNDNFIVFLNKLSLFHLSDYRFNKIYDLYDKAIIKLQKSVQIQLNYHLLFIVKNSPDWLTEIENFSLLKKNLDQFTL